MIKFIYKIYVPKELPHVTQVKLRARLANFFPGYTQYEASGYWEGTFEVTDVYEIISDEKCITVLESIKKDMLDAGEQEVLITMDTITVF